MANGWSGSDYQLADTQSIAASQTNQVISKEFPISAGGSKNIVIKIKVSAATVAAAITAKLQTALNGDWVDSKTVSITAGANDFYIKLNVQTAGDQTYLPLLNKGRLVITTGAGDSATLGAISVLQEL